MLVWMLFLCFTGWVAAISSTDTIVVNNLNRSFQIQNETYVFALIPTFQVPLNLVRQTIYTGTASEVLGTAKRHLRVAKRHALSVEEYDLLDGLLGELPPNVHVDSKKRSTLSENSHGFTRIPISGNSFLTFKRNSQYDATKKRSGHATEGIIGTSLCIHIPFFTTCDNSGDIQAIKDFIKTQNNAVLAQIDAFQKTNDDRMRQLVSVLNEQKANILQMLSVQQQLATQIGKLSGIVSVATGMSSHGEFITHSQINSLKRTVNSVLRLTNGISATDPRTVVAQPSLTELFAGFLEKLSLLNATSQIPIVETNTFNWTEVLLPTDYVTNVTSPSKPMSPLYPPSGVVVQLAFLCSILCDWDNKTCCYPTVSTQAWMYGPFHRAHQGIYPIAQNGQVYPATVQPIYDPSISPHTTSFFGGSKMYCVEFLGSKVLTNFATTPSMTNGISTVPYPLSDCNALMLKQGLSDGPIYAYYGDNEGIITPFYSNCNLTVLGSLTPIPLSFYSGFPGFTTTPVSSDIITDQDVYERHWVSATCFINLEPEWLQMSYFVDPESNKRSIQNIPFGYKLNQFTINTFGSLASSLEFLYTAKWAQVYTIQRISQNNVIVTEVDLLDGDTVLFNLDGTSIVDESDNFFGEGNNGRDCIRKSDSYPYDLTSCFFQNNQQLYTTDQYLKGQVITSGIARFNNKFDFLLFNSGDVITFSLTPNDRADYSFYINSDGVVCPKLVNYRGFTDRCELTFFFAGIDNAYVAGKLLKFVNYSAVVNVSLGTQEVRSLNQSCLLIECAYAYEGTIVELSTPNITIIPYLDYLGPNNGISKDQYLTLFNELAQLQQMQRDISTIYNSIANISANVSALNFDVVTQYPYMNFTDLRNAVDARIDAICSGPFSSGSCFVQYGGVGLIVVGCVGAALILGYFIYKKYMASRDATQPDFSWRQFVIKHLQEDPPEAAASKDIPLEPVRTAQSPYQQPHQPLTQSAYHLQHASVAVPVNAMGDGQYGAPELPFLPGLRHPSQAQMFSSDPMVDLSNS